MRGKLREDEEDSVTLSLSFSSTEWPEPLRKLAKNAALLGRSGVVALKLQYRKGGREWQS